MRKSDLVSSVMNILGGEVSKNAALAYVDAVLDAIVSGVKAEGEVNIAGFGNFKKKHRPARLGPKPGSPGEKINYPASTTMTFKAGKGLKERLS